MFGWLKTKKKHKHTIMWESRKVIEHTSIDFTTGTDIDIQPATKYLYQGVCVECEERIHTIKTIATMWDKEQPYDKP